MKIKVYTHYVVAANQHVGRGFISRRKPPADVVQAAGASCIV